MTEVSGPYREHASPYGKVLWGWDVFYVQSTIKKDLPGLPNFVSIKIVKVELWPKGHATCQWDWSTKYFRDLPKAMKFAARLVRIAERRHGTETTKQ